MICANYLQERESFRHFIEPKSRIKILLINGQSGLGKTTLVSSFLDEKPEEVRHVSYVFRQGYDVSMAEVFYRVVERFGWKSMPMFSKIINDFRKGAPLQIEKNSQIGSNNSISMALNAESFIEREEKRVMLTNAWFEDLGCHSGTFLLVFDGYEKATQEIQDWIAGPFLERVARLDCVRVIVAGQSTPDHNNIEWGNLCQCHQLLGISSAAEWEPIIEHMGRYIPHDQTNDPRAWLAGVCFALKGNPAAIMQVIKSLPKR